MIESAWTMGTGDDPVVATAIHSGHGLRPHVAQLMELPEDDRLREEDPYTDRWVGVAENRIVVNRSRFEIDLNRPKERAVYRVPDDSWGLDVWSSTPTDDLVAESLRIYDRFYDELGQLCDEVVQAHGHVVVLDLHSYNHRRRGPSAPNDDPALNPEINLGTESVDGSWATVVDTFANTMSWSPVDGKLLDVRSNVRFKGGHMPRWINNRYKESGCAIAVEVKKIFMDEWTGRLDEAIANAVGDALEAATRTLRVVLAER